jgi:hypothetical protein
VGEGNVVICDVVEEVNLLLRQHDACGDRVHRRIAPAFVEEAAVLVEAFKVVDVGLGTEPGETANLEVGPLHGELI